MPWVKRLSSIGENSARRNLISDFLLSLNRKILDFDGFWIWIAMLFNSYVDFITYFSLWAWNSKVSAQVHKQGWIRELSPDDWTNRFGQILVKNDGSKSSVEPPINPNSKRVRQMCPKSTNQIRRHSNSWTQRSSKLARSLSEFPILLSMLSRRT